MLEATNWSAWRRFAAPTSHEPGIGCSRREAAIDDSHPISRADRRLPRGHRHSAVLRDAAYAVVRRRHGAGDGARPGAAVRSGVRGAISLVLPVDPDAAV